MGVYSKLYNTKPLMISSFKQGRNEACLCGSGLKYKKCCGTGKVLPFSSSVEDFEWQKIRRTEGKLVDGHLIPYIRKKNPYVEEIQQAWECFLEDCPEINEAEGEILHLQLFLPWYLFDRSIINEAYLSDDNSLRSSTIAQQYLEENSQKLSSYEKDFLKEIDSTYHSFYQVLEVVPQRCIRVRDILLQTDHVLKEKKGTEYLQVGSIIFNRILTLNGQSIGIGCGPRIINFDYFPALLKLRQDCEKELGHPLTSKDLRGQFADIVRMVYLKWAYAPRKPLKLANTDGDPIEWCKVHFKLKVSLDQALEKLAKLTLQDSVEELLEMAEHNESGEISRIDFPWQKKGNKINKSWTNTILGKIILEDDNLFIEVNSRQRAEKIRKTIEKLMGNQAVYKVTRLELPLEEPEEKEEDLEDALSSEDLMSLPGVQQEIKRMATRHWKEWLNESLPALNDQTPRQAVKSSQGRELLEALLKEFEGSSQKWPDNLMNPPVALLRQKLGLEES